VKLTAEEFKNQEQKSITLLGMSGVGKTFLSNILRSSDWFHYSGDYRIGTRYLDEAILDNIKIQAMQVPFLKDLLRSDSLDLGNNITVDHLKPVSAFMGKLGDPEKGGLSLAEFKRRQLLHLEAEIATMMDVPSFMRKAKLIYGYTCFLNDVGGSLCELDNEDVLKVLSDNTLILYIRANEQDETALIERAERDPKPLFYREAFLDEQLVLYKQQFNVDYVACIDPNHFVRWIFPKLFHSRVPRYESIAEQYGYAISARDVFKVRCEADFLALIEQAIVNQEGAK